jgi:Ca2+-binding RTX toxin-like protein
MSIITFIDLGQIALGSGGFVIHGQDAGDLSGQSVASAGDVNGDGFDDLIVGAHYADGAGNLKDRAGGSYVVFGKASGFGAAIDLGQIALGSGGFVIHGQDAGDLSGQSVASAGDINGDGFDDLIVGAHYADAAGNLKDRAGGSYVVFGKASSFGAAIDLGQIALGSGGFVIHGQDAGDLSGQSVATAGDINGDGFDELIIGARYADAAGNTKSYAGGSYVVFGKASSFGAAIDLANVATGNGGFVIHGQDAGDLSGGSVASAGDINGDGFDDLVIGARYADGAGNLKDRAGGSYVVFGKSSGFGAAIDLGQIALGNGGFVIHGQDAGDFSGGSVASAGDINGDGFDDLIVGASRADAAGNTKSYAGGSYLVFGKASGFGAAIDLGQVALGSGGFVIHGQDAGDFSGASVAAAGDVNGDGFDDLIVGAHYADGASNLKDRTGGSYVVFGKASGFGAAIDLGQIALGNGGFVIHGQDAGDLSGGSVASAGDIDGDGFDDLIVGAHYADGASNLKDRAGGSYVIFGGDFSALVTHPGSAAADSLSGTAGADVMIGGLGNDTLNGDAGSDALRGGAGDDSLNGGAGADRIDGGSGRDTAGYAASGAGVNVNLARNLNSGGDAQGDRLADIENITGSAFADSLAGDALGNAIMGLAGQDTLRAGAGNDSLDGGADADRAVFSGNRAAYEASYDSINDRFTLVSAHEGTDIATGIETFEFADISVSAVILANPGQVIDGSNGNNNLVGTPGPDTINGFAGNDTIDGGAGIDSMAGGDGSDIYFVRNAGDLAIETSAPAAGSNDTVFAYYGGYVLAANVESGRIMFSAAGAIAGNTGNNTLYSGAGNNNLTGGLGLDSASYLYASSAITADLSIAGAQPTGGSGSDTFVGIENLSGSAFDDNLTGDASANILDGGAGADVMTGGDGADRYLVRDAGDQVTETNAAATGGVDLVWSYLSSTTLGSHVENGRILINSAANLNGNSLNNTLYAAAGDNLFDGGAGGDSVSYQYAAAAISASLAIAGPQATGSSGVDGFSNIESLAGSNYSDALAGNGAINVLNGLAGNDSLDAGQGNDLLIGGAGQDNLTGGLGADRFDYNAASESGIANTSWDRITDFNSTQADKIDLSSIDADSATAGDQAFGAPVNSATAFSASTSFSAAGQLFYDATAEVLYGNTDADAAAEFAIELIGVSGLVLADFVP